MDPEIAIKIQSYLDDELGKGERRRVAKLIEQDATARRLLEELRQVRGLVRLADAPRPVVEPRGFYWVKIRNEIERYEREHAGFRRGWFGLRLPWLRWVAPVGAVVVMLLALVYSGFRPGMAKASKPARSYHEVVSAQTETSFLTFRSDAEGMTVVWINNY